MRYVNRRGVWIGPEILPWGSLGGSTYTMDAAGESIATIGRVVLENGPVSTKVISAAGGGSIWWFNPSTNTFANAGTNLRVGLQDVSAGLEDGTFDVYDDLVGGTDTLTSGSPKQITMSSGTKTLTHGQEIAFCIEMTARGGADSVVAQGWGSNQLYPYRTADTGSGPAKASNSIVGLLIVFDDGSLGWIHGIVTYKPHSVATYNNGSTPDEYGLYIVPDNTLITEHIGLYLSAIATTDTFDVCIYSDPLGSPLLEDSFTVDPVKLGDNINHGIVNAPFDEFRFKADTPYLISALPTSVNSIGLSRLEFAAAGHRITSLIGTSWQQGTRSNGSGAFSLTNTLVPIIGIFAKEIKARTRVYTS